MVTSRRPLALSAAVLLLVAAGHAAPRTQKPTLVEGSGTSRAGLFTAGAEGATYAICGSGQLRLGAGSEVRLFPIAQRLAAALHARTRPWMRG